MVETLKYWKTEKESGKDKKDLIYQNAINWLAYESFSETEEMDETAKLILAGILFFEYNELSDSITQLTGSGRQPVEFIDFKAWLVYVKNLGDPAVFSQAFLGVLNYLNGKLYPEETHAAFSKKIREIKEILGRSPKQDQLAYELTETPPLSQISFIQDSDMALITQILLARYS